MQAILSINLSEIVVLNPDLKETDELIKDFT